MRKLVNKKHHILLTLACLAASMGLVDVAEAATLSVTPGTGVYTVGNTFTAQVVVNTEGDAINAAEGALKFNPAQVQVVGITKGSIFSLWTAEPSFSNTAGTISFSGGSPSGYTGGRGAILNITFRAATAGTSKVSFNSGSVLAADGRGTNVLRSMSGGSFTLASASVVPTPEVIEYVPPANTPGAPIITSDTHDDPEGWYNTATATLSWSIPSGVTAVRTLLDDASGSIPTKVYDPPIDSITLGDLDEGVQYFHLQFRNNDGWGKVAHYRIAVDTEIPEDFSIGLSEDSDLTSPNQTLVFTTEDEGSPINRYLIQLDGADPYEFVDEYASGTHSLTNLEPGHHTLIIEAFDEAGNGIIRTFSFAILAFDKPQFTEFPTEMTESVIPVIRGITRPESTVEVTLREVGTGSSRADSTKLYQLQSDTEGIFTFIPEGTLSMGVYELTAVATDQYGAKSDPSDPITIVVQKPGYVTVGSWLLSILSIVVPLVALIILLILVVIYGYNRIVTTRRVVTKETKEALAILEREFATLEKTLDAEAELMKTSRRTKKLTKAEEELVETMTNSLKKSRAAIAKEVAEVDDKV